MSKAKSALSVLAAALALLASWQLVVASFGIPRYILPAPLDIVIRFYQDGDKLSSAAVITVAEGLLGFFLGSIVGVALAVSMVLLPVLEITVLPLAVAINSVPIIAFVPLALVIFGLGMSSKIALATLAVVFAVQLNTLTGLKQPDPAAIHLMRSFGAGRFGILWRLQLPTSLPLLTTGLRIGISRCMIAVIVAEMLGAYQGLGQIIFQSAGQSDNLSVWTAAFAAMLCSLLLYLLLVAVDQRIVWWR
jgi:NitT/TauT family transport system permease protein